MTLRSLAVMIVGLATTAVLLASPALAGFEALAGRWQSEPIVIDSAPACAPETITVTIAGNGDKPDIAIKAGSAVDLDTTLAKGEDGAVFVEQSGWLKRFGMSDETQRDAFMNLEPVLWARETGTGVVIYRARIQDNGTLNLFRLALEPVDGGIAATLELAEGDCRVEPFTTSLIGQ